MRHSAKFLVALVGTLAAAAEAGLVTASYAKWIAVGLFFLTAIGVYEVSNE